MVKWVIVLLLSFLAVGVVSCAPAPEVGPPLEGEITALAEEFIASLVAGDYSGAVSYFDAQMLKALPEKKLKQTWEGLLQQMGPYQGEVEKRVEQSGQYEAVNVITDFAQGQLNIRVVFNSDHRVSGLWFKPVE